MDDENVPSLVPPQLRVNKTSRHSVTNKSTDASSSIDCLGDNVDLKSGNNSKPASLKSEYDSSGDTDAEVGSTGSKKRKSDNRYVDSPSSVMVKTDDESIVGHQIM